MDMHPDMENERDDSEIEASLATEPRWTPGPWRVDFEESDHPIIQAIEDKEDPWTVAEIILFCGPELPDGTDRVEYNAHLIAQAPAMHDELESLKRFLIDFNEGLEIRDDEIDDRIDRITALQAVCRGEE